MNLKDHNYTEEQRTLINMIKYSLEKITDMFNMYDLDLKFIITPKEKADEPTN